MIDLAQRIIAINSLSTEPRKSRAVLQVIRDFFSDNKVHFSEFEKNGYPSLLIANSSGLDFDVLFVGHVDVVPANRSLFEPKIEGDRILGRGAADMKGPVAALAQIMKQVVAQNISRRVGLLLTSDEEISGEWGVGHVLRQGLRSDFTIIPDGGFDFEIITREKGILQLELTAHGVAAHASRPWKGKNALQELVAVTSRILTELVKRYGVSSADDTWHTLGSLTVLQSGTAANVIPSTARAEMDFRFTEPGHYDELLNLAREACAGTDVKFLELMSGPPLLCPDVPQIAKLQKITSTYLGREVPVTDYYAACDGRYFSECGMPVIVFRSPNSGGHGDEEWVSISGLWKYVDIVLKFLRS